MEPIHSPAVPELHGQSVLRVIEVLPRDSRAWAGEVDSALVALIQGIIRWATQQGCLAADFSCSTSRLSPVLRTAGFREQSGHREGDICALAPLFRPLSYEARPLNALCRIDLPGACLQPVDFDKTYIVKSDNDMDRPNMLSVENTH